MSFKLGGTGAGSLAELTEALAAGDRFAMLNVSDDTTAPADADGSNQWISAEDAAVAFFRLATGGEISTGQAWQLLAASHSAHLANWIVGLALGDANPVVVGFVGDSFGTGNLAGLTWEQTWPHLLQKRLNARYPSSVATGQGRGMLPPISPGATVDLDYVAVTVAPEVWWGHGFSAGANIADVGSGAVTLTYSLVGDNAVIAYYQQAGGGSFEYTLDGGSPRTVSTAAGAPGAGAEVVSLGSAGAHTIVITWVAASGNTVIQGIAEYNGDFGAGLQVWNAGLSGSKASDWAGYDWFQWAGSGIVLLVVELGVADLIAADSPATYASHLTAVIAAARTAVSESLNVLLVAPPYGGDGWPAYIEQMYAIAAADSLCDVLDLTARIPLSNTYVFDSGSGELTATGHVAVANAVAAVLEPQ